MKLDSVFRLSNYLALGVATACLGYTEEAFLPGTAAFTGAILLLIVVAFSLEGRWSLSLMAANLVGVGIAAGTGLWIAFQFMNPSNDFVRFAPWPAVMLPYLGPILMVLLLAKLFRPKVLTDFRQLYTIGLMEVILACVLAVEPLFGLLLVGYLLCGIWSLSVFYVYREQQAAAGTPAEEVVPVPGPWRTSRLALGGLALALVLFLLTPRISDSQWDPFLLARVGPITSGFSGGVDLNRTGQLRLSDELAFMATAANHDQTPKTDLSPAQRWRGGVLDRYERGQWFNSSALFPPLYFDPVPPGRPAQSELPDLGPTQFYLTLDVDLRRTNAFLLAEPVIPTAERLAPCVAVRGDARHLWVFRAWDGTMHPVRALVPVIVYKQVTRAVREEDAVAPVEPGRYNERYYCVQPVPGIQAWTEQVLRKLQAAERLRPGDVHFSDDDIQVPLEARERVARALTHELSSSREFTYSLALRRKDRKLDPNEDFLRNVKEGHCERFASALVLALRSCGIPARMVVGYRGAEPDEGEQGRYLVRQSDAHSWVEAVVPRVVENGETRLSWLTLDPTPGTDQLEEAGSLFDGGWPRLKQFIMGTWRDYVLEYNQESQQHTTEALGSALAHGRWLPWLGGAGLAALLLVVARRYRRRARPANAVAVAPWFAPYAALLRLLRSHVHLEPGRAQTPLEFASDAGQALRDHPRASFFADLPARVVAVWYRARFGRRAPAAGEAQALEQQLGALADSLAQARPES